MTSTLDQQIIQRCQMIGWLGNSNNYVWTLYPDFGHPVCYDYVVTARMHLDLGHNLSSLIQQLCGLYCIDKSRTTLYHPAGSGQCQWFNRSLQSLLRTHEWIQADTKRQDKHRRNKKHNGLQHQTILHISKRNENKIQGSYLTTKQNNRRKRVTNNKKASLPNNYQDCSEYIIQKVMNRKHS